MNLFEQAVRQQLTFNVKGEINIIQLYAAKRTSQFVNDLVSYEEELTKQVESFGKTSRRQSVDKTKIQKDIELRLAIISSLLDEIDADKKASLETAEKNARKQQLLELIQKKQQEITANKSLEELRAELKTL